MSHFFRSLLLAPLALGTALTASFISAPLTAAAQAPLRLALTPFATGLGKVVDIAHPPGENRLYVVDKVGNIRIVTPAGAVLPTPFLNIVSRVVSTGNEQGLLGLAFHPDYATNGYFFVNYVAAGGTAGLTRIARFQRLAGTTNQADPASEVVLFSVPQPFTNHNGGTMQFGPDGFLYVGLGDGGSRNDPGNRSQNLTTPLGKILRFDVNGSTPATPHYSIPPGNPLVNTPGALPEIWLWGVRNPWRTSFDSATGDYWMGEVGQNAWEEIDVMVDSVGANHNFGWRCREGQHPAVGGATCLTATDYHAPVFEYPHNNATGGFSVTGGFVYRGTQSPALTGKYVCTDYVSGNFWTISRQGRMYTTTQDAVFQRPSITCFGQDSAGELYCGTLAGAISHLTATGPTGVAPAARPTLRLHPNPATSTCRLDLPEAVAADIELFSLVSGQVLRRTRAEAATATATLDVRGLAAGLYGVRAYLPGRTLSQRLLVRAD